jgi:hypothetical protein
VRQVVQRRGDSLSLFEPSSTVSTGIDVSPEGSHAEAFSLVQKEIDLVGK